MDDDLDLDKLLKEIYTEIMSILEEACDIISNYGMHIRKNKELKNILLTYKEKTPKTEEEINDVMSILCFKNIAYCCGVKKNCFRRDIVLKIFGMSKENYTKEKEIFGKKLIKNIS